MSASEESSPFPDPVPVPVTGELDLHTFRPRDLGDLLPEYLWECRQRGLLTVRIVHGKGTGTLRTAVHALLQRLPEVQGFCLADEKSGGWGATIVTLAPLQK
ncbi:MAG TPA: Smr/MutS family protein [Verrucomicrobiales bacterium]|jgi:DNA-nicking Smr family endonuclease|nr:Smr/MutS family protein [Verrucomicrobiales bacterium]